MMQHPRVISDSLLASLFVNCFAAPCPSLSHHVSAVFVNRSNPFSLALILSQSAVLPLSSNIHSFSSLFSLLVPLLALFSHSLFNLCFYLPSVFLISFSLPTDRQLFHLGHLINLINQNTHPEECANKYNKYTNYPCETT